MSPSPFALGGARFVERGYSAVPIMPNSKSPGEMRRGKWKEMIDWRRFAARLPTVLELEIWSTWPDAGIGVVADEAGWRIVAVDIDSDNTDIAAAIIAAVPPTTVIKRGAKGSTRFYRGPSIARAKSWRLHGELQVCDLIGPGRQTVLPPSQHPTTGKSYVWIGPDALEDVAPADLPELTPAHVAAIDAALAPFGYQKPASLPEHPTTFACDDKRGREYALGVMHGLAGDLARQQQGGRNNLLFFTTMRMGRCIARGWLSETEAWAAAWNACIANGVLHDDGERQFAATFASGMRKGLVDPMPDPRERLTPDPEFSARIANLKPRAAQSITDKK